MRLAAILIIFIAYLGNSYAGSEKCSTPSSNVMKLVNLVIAEMGKKDIFSYEEALNELYKDKSNEATEALVRLMSVYLGSEPGVTRNCEIFSRGKAALKYLENPKFCLDSSMVEKELLSSNGPEFTKMKKRSIRKNIISGDERYCKFDH